MAKTTTKRTAKKTAKKAPAKKPAARTGTVYLIANGDLRASANQSCEAEQQAMERKLIDVCEELGATVKRAHGYRADVGHSFIDSQTYGRAVFRDIPPDAPLIVAEAVWQYSHHVLSGLMQHEGPILTVANWSGTWPGLVGMLNLNGSLTKAGVDYSTLWSEDFATDDVFRKKLGEWLGGKPVRWNTGHAGALEAKLKRIGDDLPDSAKDAEEIGRAFARAFRASKPIMGVFDEGCMGMFNAIVPDHLLNPTGVFKERLSQSALYYAMTQVKDKEAKEVFDWYTDKGMTFHFGADDKKDLTKEQVLEQCKMYVAALRIADEFGCDTIGIQYQQGLKDLAPASDLVEGTLNNRKRPPVEGPDGKVLYKKDALPHFNEVDECAGLDGLLTYRLWKELGYKPENTLHDLRWGRHYSGPGKNADNKKADLDAYVWVFEISGGAPPAHFVKGWKGTHGYRQPPMYFRLGGSTCTGVSKPGHVVWSRVYIEKGKLKADLGLADALGLPEEETQDRLDQTTPQWPVMHAALRGTTRDQMMAKHKSNHIQVVYAPSESDAIRGLLAKAHAFDELGLDVTLCGDVEPSGV